jgi:hypothetical protein
MPGTSSTDKDFSRSFTHDPEEAFETVKVGKGTSARQVKIELGFDPGEYDRQSDSKILEIVAGIRKAFRTKHNEKTFLIRRDLKGNLDPINFDSIERDFQAYKLHVHEGVSQSSIAELFCLIGALSDSAVNKGSNEPKRGTKRSTIACSDF